MQLPFGNMWCDMIIKIKIKKSDDLKIVINLGLTKEYSYVYRQRGFKMIIEIETAIHLPLTKSGDPTCLKHQTVLILSKLKFGIFVGKYNIFLN